MQVRRVLAIVIICVIIAAATVPIVSAQEIPGDWFNVYRGTGPPKANEVTVSYTASDTGILWLHIQDNGLRAVKVEIADTSSGGYDVLLTERIHFGKDLYSEMNSSNVSVIAGNQYSITVTPGSGKGGWGTITPYLLPAEPIPPMAIIMGPSSGIAGDTLTFDGSNSYDPDGEIALYEWTVDGVFAGNDITMSYTFTEERNYTVTLTVTDYSALTNSTDHNVTMIVKGRITYKISDIGSVYLKSTDYSKRGVMTNMMGINSWWPVRTFGYGETVIRDDWPYIMATGSSSPITSPEDPSQDWPFYIWTFFNYTIEARNIEDINTSAGIDSIIVPLLDSTWYEVPGAPIEERLAWDGGTVEFAWLNNYLIATEISDIRNGLHYANTYYGVPTGAVNVADDGWWLETHGTAAFDRDAAKKFLGLSGVGDLRDEYSINQPSSYGYREIDLSWLKDWMNEGNGIYDIYTAYGYSLDIKHLRTELNPESNADYLKLNIWSISWGLEILMWRYLEATDISPNWQVISEPLIVRGSINTTTANIDVNTVGCYNMLTWKDYGTGGPAWNLFPVHIDHGGNLPDPIFFYISPFNGYDPEPNPFYPDPARNPLTQTWTPGLVNHGQWVFYCFTPTDMSLVAGQTLIYQLPMVPFFFIAPYVGTDDGYSSSTGLAPWKISEILSHGYWGEPGLSPSSTPELLPGYNLATKTITIVGPVEFTKKYNPVYNDILLYGTPEMLMVAV